MIAKFANLTPSSAAALPCPKRFLGEFVEKRAKRPGFAAPLAFGMAVHLALKVAFLPGDVPPNERDFELIARRAVFQQGYPDGTLRASDQDRCVQILRAYVPNSDPDAETIALEEFANTTLVTETRHRLTLGAKFDRLFVRPAEPGHLIVKDYKTGSPGPVDVEGACIMLAVAARCYKEFGTYSVEYDFVGVDGLTDRRVVTFGEAKTVWPDLKAKALPMYNATEFPAIKGEHCGFCPFRAECYPETTTTMDDLDELFV